MNALLQANDLAGAYAAVRARTEALVAPLSAEDCQLQSMPDASPAKWHLAHTTWFFETFLLERFEPGFEPFDAAFRVLFNSYYQGVGPQHPRAQRGLLSRPTLDQVRAWRRQVDARMQSLIAVHGGVGGLLEAKKIAGMAEVRHVQIAPHLYCGPIVGAANIQLAACSPNFLILESIEDWSGFHSQILKTPIRFEDGHVIPPDAPGLGVEIDEAVALANPYTGHMLHLEMTQHPVR